MRRIAGEQSTDQPTKYSGHATQIGDRQHAGIAVANNCAERRRPEGNPGCSLTVARHDNYGHTVVQSLVELAAELIRERKLRETRWHLPGACALSP